MRSGLPDGLVFWVCHGDVRSVYPTVLDRYMVRYIVGLYGIYGTSLVFRVWYIVGV